MKDAFIHFRLQNLQEGCKCFNSDGYNNIVHQENHRELRENPVKKQVKFSHFKSNFDPPPFFLENTEQLLFETLYQANKKSKKVLVLG